MGWSDTSPQPRTPNQNARELYTLLTRAGIEGPYVLVDTPSAARMYACLRYNTPTWLPEWY